MRDYVDFGWPFTVIEYTGKGYEEKQCLLAYNDIHSLIYWTGFGHAVADKRLGDCYHYYVEEEGIRYGIIYELNDQSLKREEAIKKLDEHMKQEKAHIRAEKNQLDEYAKWIRSHNAKKRQDEHEKACQEMREAISKLIHCAGFIEILKELPVEYTEILNKYFEIFTGKPTDVDALALIYENVIPKSVLIRKLIDGLTLIKNKTTFLATTMDQVLKPFDEGTQKKIEMSQQDRKF